MSAETVAPPAAVDQGPADRDPVAAALWIIDNQLSRRNISAYARVSLELLKAPLIAKPAKDNQRVRKGNQPGATFQNSEKLLVKDTTKEIANQFGISPRTVYNAETFANAVDLIAERDGEKKRQEILAGEYTQKEVIESASAPGPT